MRLDAEQIFDAAAHLLGPWLGAEHAVFQRNLRKRNPRITQRLTEKQRIRGGAAEHRRMKIPEDLKLAFGVAGRGRNHRSADFSRAVMQAESAGKQPIAIGDVHKIAGISARCRQGTGGALRPHVEVVLGISNHRLFPGGPGGGVNPYHFIHRRRKKAIGIVVAQVLLISKGQLGQVIDAADVIRPDSHLVKLFVIKRDVLINPSHGA